MTDSIPASVAAVFESYPSPVQEKLLDLRDLILETAATTEGVGSLTEALRWGEPSYLTTNPKTGTTVRIAPVRGTDDQYGLYVNCQTTLVTTYRQMYPDLFTFDGTRALVFDADDEIPRDALAHCIALALRYHLDKKDTA